MRLVVDRLRRDDMRRTSNVQAVHDGDLVEFLRVLDLLDQEGRAVCDFCSRHFVATRLGVLVPSGSKFLVSCDDPACFAQAMAQHQRGARR